MKYFCCTLPSRLQVSVVPPTCYLVVPAGMGTVVPKSTCYLVVPVPGSTCWTVLLQTCWTRYNCKPAGTIANLLDQVRLQTCWYDCKPAGRDGEEVARLRCPCGTRALCRPPTGCTSLQHSIIIRSLYIVFDILNLSG